MPRPTTLTNTARNETSCLKGQMSVAFPWCKQDGVPWYALRLGLDLQVFLLPLRRTRIKRSVHLSFSRHICPTKRLPLAAMRMYAVLAEQLLSSRHSRSNATCNNCSTFNTWSTFWPSEHLRLVTARYIDTADNDGAGGATRQGAPPLAGDLYLDFLFFLQTFTPARFMAPRN